MRGYMTIGRLAQQANVDLETIRYWERIGLMPDPARSAGGHRCYDSAHLQRLIFIRRTRELGFRTGAIRDLLSLSQPGMAVCAEVKEIAEQQLLLVEERIKSLSHLQARLRETVAVCDPKQGSDCPIIADLGG